MERKFAKGLKSSAPTVSEENGMLTVQNLSNVQRKCGVRGRTELHKRVNDEQEREHRGEGE